MNKLIVLLTCILSISCNQSTQGFKDGDIIFQTSKSSQSKMLKVVTKSNLTHCGVIFHKNGKPFVFEAVQPVKVTPLKEWINRGKDTKYSVTRLTYDLSESAKKDMITAVNYTGPAPAGVDVAGGQVDFGIIPAAVAYNLVKSGKVKYIGIFGEQRLARIPDVPLMQIVVPGANVYAGWGILLPKGTSPEVVKWYTDSFTRAIRSTEAQRFFDDNLMFVEERELSPQGYKRSMLELRRVWLPIAQKMDFGANK